MRRVRVDDAIADYLLDIVHATREGDDLHVGVSTRGALTLYRASQSLALVSGPGLRRPPTTSRRWPSRSLAHRVVGKSFLQAGEFGAAESIIRDLVDRLKRPHLIDPSPASTGLPDRRLHARHRHKQAESHEMPAR